MWEGARSLVNLLERWLNFVASTITLSEDGFCTQSRPKANEFQRYRCRSSIFFTFCLSKGFFEMVVGI